jgi:hypothetical protein
MPDPLCPLCAKPGRLLDVAHSNPFKPLVDYYRCDGCPHVWWQSKTDPNAPPVDVTPKTKAISRRVP